MKIPIFLISFITFIAVITVKNKRNSRKQSDTNEAFLERERRANTTRKKDISSLNYLPFTTDALPLSRCFDEEIGRCEKILLGLSGKKIINLSNYSNTDLKLMYGPANLNELSEYDENYHTLSTTLLAYAKREISLNRTEDAMQILAYAMTLHIDSSQIYLTLAELYQKQSMPEKIEEIRKTLEGMEESFSSPVLAKISALL